jgi:16S rRNA (guanine(966)-N(2))-methyltransferase RsmD
MRAAGMTPAGAAGSVAMRDARRWKPHILSGAPLPVVSAERPGWTRSVAVVTLALRPSRIDVAGAFKRNRNCMPRSAPSRAHGASSKSGKPHAIRIIGGDWKRTPLPVLDLDGLRPTPDRVRETLFNWLGQNLDGQRCLDLFAGSGALGFEAASRGAARVLMVERNARAASQLRANQERLSARTIEIAEADGLRLAASLAPGSFDVVFLDPPFGEDLLGKALALAVPLVSADGFLYVEAGEALEVEENETLAGWEIVRQGKAGAVHFHLLQRENKE